jgi:hypothetical protein
MASPVDHEEDRQAGFGAGALLRCGSDGDRVRIIRSGAGYSLRLRHHQPGKRQAILIQVGQSNKLAYRACAARFAVSEHCAKLISSRLFELKIGAIGQSGGLCFLVSLLIKIENKAMRGEVSRYLNPRKNTPSIARELGWNILSRI